MNRIRWSVGRRLSAIIAIAALVILTQGVVSWRSARDVAADVDDVHVDGQAQAIYQALDTRASELKVSALKAVLVADPAAVTADVEEDAATVDELLAGLDDLDLSNEAAARAREVRGAFDAYTPAISSFVDDAVAEQAAQVNKIDLIQSANDALDKTLGEAVEASGSDADAQTANALGTASGLRRIVLVLAAAGLAILVSAGFALTRSLVRPLSLVVAALKRFASGDITVRLEERSSGEVRDLQESFNQTVESVNAIVATVAASADAVAAASEELSASSQQIAAGAEETSVQAGVVSGAPTRCHATSQPSPPEPKR